MEWLNVQIAKQKTKSQTKHGNTLTKTENTASR